jgi:DNA polymerase (family 10)
VDLRAVSEEEFPYTLHHFTGSKEHNVALRARAQSQGLKINEYGLWKGEDRVPCKNEEEFFAALGLAFIEPEMREDQGEIVAAENNELPQLLRQEDLKGVLHNHTIYSDGVCTPREMAEAARDRGYAYIGLTDHSQSARYANGMQPADVERYLKELDELNDELEGIQIFKGTECDILPDGTLDYLDEILAQFDFIIGSVHTSFGMPEDEMTARVLRAMESPYMDMLGHPTGRLLLSREPYAINMARICAVAAERGVAIEINANPHRLDLDWREIKGFRSLGGWVSINPDAHRIEGLDDVQYGVSIARKGWVTKERVLNALTAQELGERFRSRR